MTRSGAAMSGLRFGRWFACGLMVAAVTGCGDKPARILSPVPHAPRGVAPASRGQVVTDTPLGANLPPTVRITCPVPSPLVTHVTPPALRILWEGSDPDGQFTTRPVKYKYILLGQGSEFPPSLVLSDPDSLRRYYLPRAWAGWDSTGADTTRAQYRNLVTGSEYVFAVIAFDETGAYSPVFSLSLNILHFRVSYDGYPGLPLTVIGPGFEHTFTGYDPSSQVSMDLEERRNVVPRWSAESGGTCQGVDVRGYRWALDLADLYDETPRTDEQTDLRHWSQRSLATTSATIGPFRLSSPPAPEYHVLYVESEDIVGTRTLGTVRITVVPAANRPPDCSGATAAVATSWPPDGSMAPVSISGVSDPDGDPVTIEVTGVTQDEPVDDVGDGNTCPDAVIVDGTAQVRRERSARGNGRVYTVWFTADDGQGGTCSGAADVCIRRDGGFGRPCIKDDRVVNSLGPCGADRARERGRIALPPGNGR